MEGNFIINLSKGQKIVFKSLRVFQVISTHEGIRILPSEFRFPRRSALLDQLQGA